MCRELVQMTYKPPQIPHGLALDAIADEYMSDYRRVYVERPRLRLDGVYIAVCHYVCVY
jgi:F-box protein 9